MKVTTAHMGNMYIALSALFERFGLEYVVPPAITEKTYEIGFDLAPEQVCLPFKVCLGNYVEAISKGADTIIMAGGNGPCRFGFYGMLQEKILKDAGYGAKMIILNQDNIMEVLNDLSKVTGKSNLKLLSYFYFAWKILRLVEENDKLAAYFRAYSSEKNKVEKLHREIELEILNAKSFSAARKLMKILKARYKTEVPLDLNPAEILKVGLLGEIYMVLDGRVNMNIEKILGNLNVWVKRTIYISEWILRLTGLNFFTKNSQSALKKIAKPYLASDVGGKGIQTIASAITFAKEKADGLVHITPFSCMPELVATTILPKVCSDYKIPCLYLTFDEHTSEAAVITRVEAYVDMLRMSGENAQK
ncbi:MAG: CoA protein activase [Candidatus Wallbacteria bacterium]